MCMIFYIYIYIKQYINDYLCESKSKIKYTRKVYINFYKLQTYFSIVIFKIFIFKYFDLFKGSCGKILFYFDFSLHEELIMYLSLLLRPL